MLEAIEEGRVGHARRSTGPRRGLRGPADPSLQCASSAWITVRTSWASASALAATSFASASSFR